MRKALSRSAPAWLALLLAAAGCTDGDVGLGAAPATQPGNGGGASQAVPAPIDLLLPQRIRIHPFTGTRTFDAAGGVRGIDVRIEATDAFEDPTKAFGDFRFELYTHEAHGPDPKGRRIAVWRVSLLEARQNVLHWDGIAKRYQFKLKWTHPIPVGQQFVLTATFTSPFSRRLFDERVFVSGQ